MGLKQVIKQRQGFVKGKLKGVSKDKSKQVMEVLESNHPISELIENIAKLEIFKERDLNDIKKHFEKIDLSERLGK